MKKEKRGREKNHGTANHSERDSRTNRPPDLAEACVIAAEQLGEDRKGKDGLSGFLRRLAETDPRFYSKLSRGLPESDPDQLAAAMYRSVRLRQRS